MSRARHATSGYACACYWVGLDQSSNLLPQGTHRNKSSTVEGLEHERRSVSQHIASNEGIQPLLRMQAVHCVLPSLVSHHTDR